MDFTGWKYYQCNGVNIGITDGENESRGLQDPDVVEWLAAGNVPIPADAPEETYKQLRIYPPIGDQLDMQYHDALNGTTVWRDTIAAVKSKFPKPA